ncbi:hypothetical protein, partial [uncultured Lamprocystis sp.]|uniref:hypothetical protein n=1 Tax=uncultured Lamprocystis sp. TaxID=543132 RepID=UPI0025D58C2F
GFPGTLRNIRVSTIPVNPWEQIIQGAGFKPAPTRRSVWISGTNAIGAAAEQRKNDLVGWTAAVEHLAMSRYDAVCYNCGRLHQEPP